MNIKTYKQAFVVLAVGMFIVPQVAFAAWWSPLSWFEDLKSGQKTVISSSTEQASPAIQKTDDVNTDGSANENLTPKSERSVSEAQNTISEQNYDNEIYALKQEIQSLKSSLVSIQKSYNDLQASLDNKSGSNTVSDQSSAKRIDNLEKRVDGISKELGGVNVDGINVRLSKIESQTGSKNYDSQISEMAKRINALMHSKVNTETIACTLGQQPYITFKSGEELYPSCASVYADLNY